MGAECKWPEQPRSGMRANRYSQPGWITLDGGFAARHCVVQDMSTTGAKITVDDSNVLPGQVAAGVRARRQDRAELRSGLAPRKVARRQVRPLANQRAIKAMRNVDHTRCAVCRCGCEQPASVAEPRPPEQLLPLRRGAGAGNSWQPTVRVCESTAPAARQVRRRSKSEQAVTLSRSRHRRRDELLKSRTARRIARTSVRDAPAAAC